MSSVNSESSKSESATNAPLVSVVIPNYNYAHYVAQAIDSVLAQTYPNVEIIVVDDGSKDDSLAVLRGYGDKIRWIQQKNQGVAVARNRGFAESQGEFVGFLDADDVWLPTKLERQIQCFKDNPGLGLVHCGLEEVDAAGATLQVRLDGLAGWVAPEMLLFRRGVVLGGGSGVVVPRAVGEAVGGFDTRQSTSADWDFHCRVACRYEVGFVLEVLLKYRVHGSNMHKNVRAMEHDMMLAYAAAFVTKAPELMRIRRQAYGNLHMTLAGSYFAARQMRPFLRHTLRSLWLTPGNFSYLIGFVKRRLQRTTPHHHTAFTASAGR